MEFLAVWTRVGLRARGDHQLAVLDARILRAIGVVLQFVIPPTVSTDVIRPLRHVRRRSTLSLEFIAPNQRVPLRRMYSPGLRGRHKQSRRDEQNALARL